MPNPPPPPPGPPPPPMFTASVNSKGSNEPQARNMLLTSIRQGTKLKKTVTVDKSAPAIGNAKSTPNNSSLHGGARSNGGSAPDLPRANGPIGLGGLFAGGMPKLKATGRGIGGSASSLAQNDQEVRSNNSVINHQKKNSIGQNSIAGDIKNRGPPPQPPPANRKPSIGGMHTSTSDSVLANTAPRKQTPPLPHKPPVGGYGKPNLAPRPPGQPPGNKPAPPPKSPNVHAVANGPPSLPSRPPSVSRAQSMRTPRSPSSGSSTPTELGEYRTQHFQSQEGLHHMTNGLNYSQRPPRTSTLPSNLNQSGGSSGKSLAPAPPSLTRMAPAPPALSAKPTPIRAPSVRPPPPPSRVAINPPANPPPPPPTVAPPPPLAPPPPSSAPPPPPHRTAPSSAAAPKLSSRLPSNTMQTPPPGAPPLPPIRNSSMRNGSAALGDFEARFADLFHKVHEFPPPDRYMNVPKVYNSRNAKQQAPQPPRSANVHLQLSNKMWANDTSTC